MLQLFENFFCFFLPPAAFFLKELFLFDAAKLSKVTPVRKPILTSGCRCYQMVNKPVPRHAPSFFHRAEIRCLQALAPFS
jgi:hypothetical protein